MVAQRMVRRDGRVGEGPVRAHAQTLHHPARGDIALRRVGHDRGHAAAPEQVREGGAGRARRDAPAPGAAGETPADLDALARPLAARERHRPHHPQGADEADEAARLLDRPGAEPVRREAPVEGARLVQALGTAAQARKMRHHGRVGVEGCEGRVVAPPPASQQEAARRDEFVGSRRRPSLAAPEQRAAVQQVELRAAREHRLAELDRQGEPLRRQVGPGGHAHALAPGAAAGIVEQDAGEAVIAVHRPVRAGPGGLGQAPVDEVAPARLRIRRGRDRDGGEGRRGADRRKLPRGRTRRGALTRRPRRPASRRRASAPGPAR